MSNESEAFREWWEPVSMVVSDDQKQFHYTSTRLAWDAALRWAIAKCKESMEENDNPNMPPEYDVLLRINEGLNDKGVDSER